MRGSLTRRVVLASAALVVLIAGAFVVLLLALDSTRDSGALARHSRVELAAANRLEKLLLDLETGQRGFVITHEPRFLTPWRIARSDLPAARRRLLSLADDPGQRRRGARLAQSIEDYVRDYSLPLVAAARRRDPAAASVRETLRGKRLVDELRAGFNRYVATERDLLTARQAEADSDAHKATVAASAGLVGSIVLIVLFASYLARAILLPVRRAAGMAGRIAGGELSPRMPESGTGEVAMLEGSFNKMAASLEQSQAANAESRAELAASRARVVAAADDARRRIERDLHDGTQQRLVTLGLKLRAAEALAAPEEAGLKAELASAADSLTSAVEELQEISRGIHPAVLSRGGLGPALRSLARRSSVPVELQVEVDRRLPEQVEVATYYLVSEALTNAAKHSQASLLRVRAGADNGVVRLSIADDGVGGADLAGGSGLVGLKDRVAALGGELRISSAPGEGTELDATIPIPQVE
jgi:signal transduction histidine kinase